MPVCPNCGENNPDRARFCGACGSPLDAVPMPSTDERKVVSVLFVDLVGFTARAERADPEDVIAALRPYHALLKGEIERFGGTVEKFIGDAVMAVFGAPVAHEDDAERSVRAALRIVEAILELNEEHPGLELSVRAAVNTGETVVALSARAERGESIVAGDVVNTAARLQQEAPVGGVVVGEVTQRTTRDVIDYESLEPVKVKGKTEPIPIWRAVAARGRFGVDVERPKTPFVGREDDLALLRQTYARTLRESSVQVVTITGEPGVGKTRLVAEFHRFVDDQPELVFWRQGRCLPYGEGIAFWALGEIVKSHAGIMESDGPGEAARKLSETVELAVEEGEREWVRRRLAPLIALAAEDPGVAGREESFAAWRAFLESVATARPLVLVVEDLHWADEALLGFVEHLVDWSTGVPMMVVCTARPELYERHPGWGGGKRNSATTGLSPLSAEETARLTSALLGSSVLPADVQAALLERAGGNPLYAEELVRMLVDRQILVRSGVTWTLASDRGIELPETVHALIAARLDTLPPERKAMLQDAAVLGKVFWAGAVAAMGGLEEASVAEGLHELTRKELVRPARRSSVDGEREFSFWHLLIRDVAYGQIPRAARAVKHLAAGEWIEKLAGERVADHAEVLAHHYGQAREFARAAGQAETAEALGERTRAFLILAGERTKSLDLPKAESYFTEALALLPQGHPDRSKVLVHLAQATWEAGRFLDAKRSYVEAIAGFEARFDGLGAGEAKARLADVLHTQGDGAAAHELLAEAVETLESLPPGRGLAFAYVLTARQCQWEGRPDAEALEYAKKAQVIADRIGARDQSVRARQFAGFARCNLGDPAGIEDLRQALRLGLEWGLGQETAHGFLNLADWAWQLEGPSRGLEIQYEGIAFAERRGLQQAAMWTKAESVWTLFELGRWDDVLGAADEVTTWERAHEGTHLHAIALPCRARVLLLRGRLAEAAALSETFLPAAREVGDLQVLMPALGTAALVRLAEGDLPSALRLIEQWLELIGDGTHWLRALNLVDAVTVFTAARSFGPARKLLETFEPRSSHEQHSLVTGRAILTEAAAEPEEAAPLYTEAAGQWARFGHVPERGRCLLGAGRCLLALDRPSAAMTLLRDARDVFLGLAAEPLVAESDVLLERATALTS